MIRINLLATREVEEASSRRRELTLLGVIVVGAILASCFAYSLQQKQFTQIKAKAAELRQEVAQIKKRNTEVDKLIKQKGLLEEKLAVVRSLTSPQRRAAPVRILADLSASTPEFLWLTDFSEKNGVAKVQGESVDNQTIASFARNLAQSPYFEKVEIRETVQETRGSAPRRLRGRRRQIATNEAPSSVSIKKFLIEASLPYVQTEKVAAQAQEG